MWKLRSDQLIAATGRRPNSDLLQVEKTGVKIDERGYIITDDYLETCVKVIQTPGHSPEHLCILVEDSVLLSGDCLLIGDVGRTDLGRGNASHHYDSLYGRLLELPETVKVYPAHWGLHTVSADLSSTIGVEKKINPALQLTKE